MTAISGLFSRDGLPLRVEDHDAMMAPLAYRAAGASETWRRPRVMLGQQGNPNIPETRLGPSNFLGRNGHIVVGDVRLDNRQELLSSLCRDQPASTPTPDLELVERAYERWGDEAPEHLIGEFAFAIWDDQRAVLFCATDCFGIRPLYFYCSPDLFAFATEVKALLQLPTVPRRLNEERLADYLVPMLEDTRATLYRDIGKLAPAHSLTVTSAALRERRYWSLNPHATITLRSDQEYAEAFRAHFTNALAGAMRASGPVGSMLSGGLDSSSIVCVARKARPGGEELPTFSAIYETSHECDEREFIDAVTAGGGVEPHYVQPETLSLFREWEEGTDFEDEPIWDPQTGVQWALCRAAGKAGVVVLLDGFGGDSVVSHGFSYLTELFGDGHWVRALSESARVSRYLQMPLGTVLRRKLVRPFAPRAALRMWGAVRRRQPGFSLPMPIQSAFASRIGFADRYAGVTSRPGPLPRTAREEHWEDLTSGFLTFSLGQADRVAASLGVEQRYPFLNRRLVEFCLALPGDQKLGGGLNRIVMRRALADLLPPKVRFRGWKANLGPSVTQRLLTADRPVIEAVLAAPGALGEYVDARALDEIYRRFRLHPGPADGYTVWRAVSLALWLRRTQDRRRTAAARPLTAVRAV